MIKYKCNNNNVYFYTLENFNLNFNLNFKLQDFLNISKDNQKNFFYSNMEFAIKKHIRNCIIKIPNYAENKDYEPLIIYLHCLTMQNIKLLKNSNIQLKIPKYTDINKKWYFDLELDSLKKLQEQENHNENSN